MARLPGGADAAAVPGRHLSAGRAGRGAHRLWRRAAAAVLPAGRRPRLRRPARRRRHLRAEPAAGARPAGVLDQRAGRLPIAGDLVDRGAGAADADALCAVAGGGADRLRPHAGPAGAGKRRRLRPPAVHHAGGLADDRAGQRRRPDLRAGDPGAERGVLPNDAGSRGGLDHRDADLGAGGDGEPRPDDAVGRDRGGAAGDRVPAGLRRAGDRHAGAGARDVAPVSAGGGVMIPSQRAFLLPSFWMAILTGYWLGNTST